MNYPGGMSIEQYAERYNRRQSLLKSKMAQDGPFNVSSATRHFSDYRKGDVVSPATMKAFLNQMVLDGLLIVSRGHRGTYFEIKRECHVSGPWVRRDNGIPLGRYYPMGNFA
jgi:hypothetical protein